MPSSDALHAQDHAAAVDSLPRAHWLQPAWLWGLVPALAAITYPYALKYSYLSTAQADAPTFGLQLFSWAALLWAILVPVIGLYFARMLPGDTHMRRIAYAAVIVPALYVFLGEIQRMFHSPVSDELVWWTLWVIVGAMAVSASQDEVQSNPPPSAARWRAVHGFTAAVITVFVLFHLFNQVVGLWGEEAYTAVQNAGRQIYRTPVIEAILVGLMISQVFSGLRIVWRWGPLRTGTARVMQVAAGNYLAVFIVAHMLSIFLYARTMSAVPTDWSYAVGAPSGLLHDGWGIRLIPHYSWGVFFVCSHIASGIRWMSIQRGMALQRAHRGWLLANAAAVLISVAVLVGILSPSL